jgi:CBS domain-containing protein
MKSLVIHRPNGMFLHNIHADELIQSLPTSLMGYFQPLEHIMSPNPLHIAQHASMEDACDQWLLNRISCLTVCDNKHVIGLLSESDVMRWLLEGAPNVQVSQYMTSPAITLQPEATVRQAWQTMCDKRVMKIIVTNDNHELLGLVTVTDILACLCANLLDTFERYHCPDDVDVLLEWRKGGMIMSVSERVLDCFGMQADEIIGLRWQNGCSSKHNNALLQLKHNQEQDVLWELGGAALPFVASRDNEQAIMWWRLKLS